MIQKISYRLLVIGVAISTSMLFLEFFNGKLYTFGLETSLFLKKALPYCVFYNFLYLAIDFILETLDYLKHEKSK